MNFKFSVAISIGGSYFGLENICKSYREAVQTLKYKFILGTNRIITNNQIHNNFVPSLLQYNYTKYLQNSLNAKNADETVKILNDFKKYLKTHLTFDSQYVYYYKDIINILIQHLNQKKYEDMDDLKNLNNVFVNFENQFDNIDEATTYLCDFIYKYVKRINNDNEQKVNKLVEKMLNIIDKEYSKDLSLTELADKLSVTDAYLCRVFKEELNKNFKEYLTEYKLAKAKELLRETELRIHEISSKVGYNNVIQFTRMFKKYEKITPGEYRNTEGQQVV